eukprot:12924754-Prorocentrum_lima.AAC.1
MAPRGLMWFLLLLLLLRALPWRGCSAGDAASDQRARFSILRGHFASGPFHSFGPALRLMTGI